MSDLVERLLAEQILQQDEYSTTTMRRNPDGPEAAARIQALETSLAEVTEDRDLWKQSEAVASEQFDKAEGRVIADVVAWLRGQADAIDRLADEADGIHLHGGGPAIRTMAKARREVATALETGEWKK